ncbi:MAG: L-threonylcarbamoyladenylate synthase [Vicinamibacterales bacterium]
MERIAIDPTSPDPEGLAIAAESLRRGGVVAYPTDTLYALAVDPRRDDAVRKLFAIKGRDYSAPIALIAADAVQARQAGVFGIAEARMAERLWPGALTIVVAAAGDLSRLLSGDLATLGVRVPAHAAARALAAAFGSCITATSANVSGQPATATPDEVAAALADRIDTLLDGGPVPGGPPSTIVQIVDGQPTMHRAGAVAWDRVLESLE